MNNSALFISNHTSEGHGNESTFTKFTGNYSRYWIHYICFYCVSMKRIILCNCLCSSSHFFASRVRDFGIINRYSWFWKSLKMSGRGSEFSFIHQTWQACDLPWEGRTHKVTYDYLITWSSEITWQTTTNSLPQRPWPYNHMTIQSRRLARSRDKKTITSSIPQYWWPPNLVGIWLTTSGFYS